MSIQRSGGDGGASRFLSRTGTGPPRRLPADPLATASVRHQGDQDRVCVTEWTGGRIRDLWSLSDPRDQFGARSVIWIASPYFVPDEGIVTSLQLAALRGVDVRVLIPGLPDKP